MKLGVLLSGSLTDAGELLADARALEDAGAHSLWVETGRDGLDPWLLLAAMAGVTGRVRLGLLEPQGNALDAPSDRLETLNWLSRSRLIRGRIGRGVVEVEAPGEPAERWDVLETVDAPSLASAREADRSVLVAMSPRLLDLLRRPDQADDRSDLILSQG